MVFNLQKLRGTRRTHQLIIVLYLAALLAAVALVVGPYLNDRTLAADGQRALATVTSVSRLGTNIEFHDGNGVFHSPASGVLYPTGLVPGQHVWVRYSANNPDLVKVEGRMWTLAVIPALSVAFSATVLAGLLWGITDLFHRRKSQLAEKHGN
ncbi:MAG: DUF3592 domain-containing protein [Corynebacterium sp.]|nr:DUF3592 domain-containing protein [Corynebacterium sp.]